MWYQFCFWLFLTHYQMLFRQSTAMFLNNSHLPTQRMLKRLFLIYHCQLIRSVVNSPSHFRRLPQQRMSLPSHRSGNENAGLPLVRPRILPTRPVLPTPPRSSGPLPQLFGRILSGGTWVSGRASSVRASRSRRIRRPEDDLDLSLLRRARSQVVSVPDSSGRNARSTTDVRWKKRSVSLLI